MRRTPPRRTWIGIAALSGLCAVERVDGQSRVETAAAHGERTLEQQAAVLPRPRIPPDVVRALDEARVAQLLRVDGRNTVALTSAAEFRTGETYGVSIDDTLRIVQNSTFFSGDSFGAVYAIPERYFTALDEGEPEPAAPEFSSTPFRYDAVDGVFRGSVGIVLVGEPSAPSLSNPVMVQVSAGVDHVDPDEVLIQHTNLPITRVELRDANPVDSVSVRVLTSSNLAGYPTRIPVEAALVIEGGSRQLQGWGVGTTRFAVLVRGTSRAPPTDVAVSLDGDGSVSPERFSIAPGSTQIVHVRSDGLSGARVTLSSSYAPASVALDYHVPLRFLLFALVGGLVGALLRVLRIDDARNRRYLRNLLGGVAWGAIVAAAGVLGLNLLAPTVLPGPLDVGNEIAVFVVSALAGLTWALTGRRTAAITSTPTANAS